METSSFCDSQNIEFSTQAGKTWKLSIMQWAACVYSRFEKFHEFERRAAFDSCFHFCWWLRDFFLGTALAFWNSPGNAYVELMRSSLTVIKRPLRCCKSLLNVGVPKIGSWVMLWENFQIRIWWAVLVARTHSCLNFEATGTTEEALLFSY